MTSNFPDSRLGRREHLCLNYSVETPCIFYLRFSVEKFGLYITPCRLPPKLPDRGRAITADKHILFKKPI
jgi:hypothetical protein